MKFLLFIASAVLIIAPGCKKSNSNSELARKWVLTEYLADPGDGSGKWQPADNLNPSYLEFKSNGHLLSNTSATFDRYQVLSDSVLRYSSSSSSTSLTVRYKLFTDSLHIFPPCYEGCGEKYKTAR